MIEVLFWLSVLFVFYAYFGYPLILAMLPKIPLDKQGASTDNLSLSIVITCRNEAAVITSKLENTLSLAYGDGSVESSKVQVIVASDASDDGTDDIVAGYEPRGVTLVRIGERSGKEFAQEAAIKECVGDVVMFTDAKTRLDEQAIKNALRYFSDPNIGAVSSIDAVESDAEGSSGEGFYVKYEMWLRDLESDVFSLVGLSGSAFFVRRQVCDVFRTDIPSDFNSLINAQRLGLRGILGRDVVCYYKAVQTTKQEFERKVRTVLRGITTLFACSDMLNPLKYGLFAWELTSHKLCRWLVPFFCVLAILCAVILAPQSGFYAFISLLIVAFVVAAGIAVKEPALAARPAFKIPLFFIVTNASIAVAWWRYFLGQRTVSWNPSRRS